MQTHTQGRQKMYLRMILLDPSILCNLKLVNKSKVWKGILHLYGRMIVFILKSDDCGVAAVVHEKYIEYREPHLKKYLLIILFHKFDRLDINK